MLIDFQAFIQDVSKSSPVAGLLQVTSENSIRILKHFSRRKLDLLSARNFKKLQHIQSEIPAFWRKLQDIISYEKETFLPHDIAEVVLM